MLFCKEKTQKVVKFLRFHSQKGIAFWTYTVPETKFYKNIFNNSNCIVLKMMIKQFDKNWKHKTGLVKCCFRIGWVRLG
jgi:hypothetical protein